MMTLFENVLLFSTAGVAVSFVALLATAIKRTTPGNRRVRHSMDLARHDRSRNHHAAHLKRVRNTKILLKGEDENRGGDELPPRMAKLDPEPPRLTIMQKLKSEVDREDHSFDFPCLKATMEAVIDKHNMIDTDPELESFDDLPVS